MTAVGTNLELSGQPFTFTGMNIYNANSDDWCANNMDGGKLETALADIGLGGVHGGDHGVIRAWFFEPLATTAARRDRATGLGSIARSRRPRAAGYFVIPTLGNQWGECGHKGPTAPVQDARAGTRRATPSSSRRIRSTPTTTRTADWVAEVVTRYKDDPTILAWQLMNEAETTAVKDDGCPAELASFNALARVRGE